MKKCHSRSTMSLRGISSTAKIPNHGWLWLIKRRCSRPSPASSGVMCSKTSIWRTQSTLTYEISTKESRSKIILKSTKWAKIVTVSWNFRLSGRVSAASQLLMDQPSKNSPGLELCSFDWDRIKYLFYKWRKNLLTDIKRKESLGWLYRLSMESR